MRLTPDADRVRAAAIAPSTSNITAAEFDRFVAKTKADAWDEGAESVTLERNGFGEWLEHEDNPYRLGPS